MPASSLRHRCSRCDGGEPLDLTKLSEQISTASAWNAAGRSAAAARSFAASLRQIERIKNVDTHIRALQVRAMFGLAATRLDTNGDLDAALEQLDLAEQVARAHDLAELMVATQGQRALLLLRAGRLEDAAAAFDVAASSIENAQARDRTRILCNRGVLLLELGRLAQARESLEAAAEAAVVEGDEGIEAMVRHNLGYVMFLAGDMPGALAQMAQAGRMAGDRPQPVLLLDQARILLEAGLIEEADGALARAGQVFSDNRRGQELGETELVRAECALLAGENETAMALARSARRRFARRDNALWVRRAELILLRIEANSTAGAGAAGLARRCRDFAQECRTEGRSELAEAGELLSAQIEVHAVSSRATLPRLRRGESVRARLQRRQVRARIHLGRRHLARARQEVAEGLRELAQLRAGFGSLDLLTASAVHGRRLAHLGLTAAVDSGAPEYVLDVVERSRLAYAQVASVTADDEIAHELGELRQIEEEARASLGVTGSARASAKRKERAAQLRHTIRAHAWERSGNAAADLTTASPDQIRSAVLTEKSAYVTFTPYSGQWLAVVVNPDGLAQFTLGETEAIAGLVRRIRADLDVLANPGIPPDMRRAVLGSLRADLDAIDDALLAPLGVAGEPLTIAPAGALATAPWSLLPSRHGQRTVVVDSATAWLRTLDPGLPAGAGVHAVAGPDLERASAEAQAVSRWWPDAIVDTTATVGALKAAFARGSLIHIAAHGQHRPESPLFSSLRMHDGPLYAYDLEAGEVAAACVILSACELGLGSMRPGDQPLGLANVLTRLGVRSVLASVATVSDADAAEVMDGVHTRLAVGLDSAAALAATLADYHADPERSPVPFTSFGGTWQPAGTALPSHGG